MMVTHFGRYKVLDELGKGAMGVVYRAHDPQIDRIVALKVLRSDRVVSEEFISRFLKEAKAIGRLSHPNIVTVYDVGQDHDTIYIAMEYLEGLPLNEHLNKSDMTLPQINDIGVQIAETLDYAHKRGIVHRDIKPTNIILTNEGRIKITDFGIAHIEDPSATQQTQAGEILGTPNYMAPEQVLGQSIDGRSDLYALGVLLYELTTRTRPFKGANIAVVFNAITSEAAVVPKTLNPDLSDCFSETILKSLNKRPDKRFQTGNEMAGALKACMVDQKKEVAKQPEEVVKNRRIWLYMALIMIICVISGVGGYRYINAHRGKTIEVTSPPKKNPTHKLVVSSNPAGAQFYVNGKFKGNTPLSLTLPVGSYEVRMSLEGYYGWEARLNLSQAGETPINQNLIPTQE